MTITILDGGISRELERVGATLRQPEWSALALIETPELVAQVHKDFAAAGAQVICTNSYAIVPFHIGEKRFAAQGADLASLSGQLARQAAAPYGALVAASLPPPLGSYRPDLFDREEARRILAVLIAGLSGHADIWLAETMSCLAEAQLVADLLTGDDRPLWLSFTLNDDGPPLLRSGETIESAALLASRVGARAILFNCSQPEIMDAAVCAAKSVLDTAAAGANRISIGVYANGFTHHAVQKDANADLHSIRQDLGPQEYLAFARQWAASGAEIIGGCCGIGAAHIAALTSGLGVTFPVPT
jgi:S-methylmethionine-dependent homocysteine/selenocysteine methylase